jgi:hypothetical protein
LEQVCLIDLDFLPLCDIILYDETAFALLASASQRTSHASMRDSSNTQGLWCGRITARGSVECWKLSFRYRVHFCGPSEMTGTNLTNALLSNSRCPKKTNFFHESFIFACLFDPYQTPQTFNRNCSSQWTTLP